MSLDDFWEAYPYLYDFLNKLVFMNEGLMVRLFDAANENQEFANKAEGVAQACVETFESAMEAIIKLASEYGIHI